MSTQISYRGNIHEKVSTQVKILILFPTCYLNFCIFENIQIQNTKLRFRGSKCSMLKRFMCKTEFQKTPPYSPKYIYTSKLDKKCIKARKQICNLDSHIFYNSSAIVKYSTCKSAPDPLSNGRENSEPLTENHAYNSLYNALYVQCRHSLRNQFFCIRETYTSYPGPRNPSENKKATKSDDIFR